MGGNIIETSIDELIQVLKKKGTMGISEVSEFLSTNQKVLEPMLNVLEEKGIIEIRYPVIGEPKIVLKSVPSEKTVKVLEKSELIKDSGLIVERPKIAERAQVGLSVRKDIKDINKKIENLENQMAEFSNEMDVSKLKENLFEIILITAGLRDIEKMSFYLKEILSIIHDMKEKGIWNNEDKDFVTTMLKEISENWKLYGEEDLSKMFDEIKNKVETA